VLAGAALGAALPANVAQRATAPLAAVEREATLVELRANPGRYLGEDVCFVLQFKRAIEDWNPYLSRFGPRDWLALEAWPDELFTWEPEVFASPAPRLFVRRGGAPEELVKRAHTYQRFEARARVREAFLGEPWIEIVELVPQEGEVGEGTILHVERARDFAFEQHYDLALEQYERAKAAPLPMHALAALEKEILETREAEEEAELAQGKGRRH